MDIIDSLLNQNVVLKSIDFEKKDIRLKILRDEVYKIVF